MGFGQGLSGLSAASQTLDVIGNNIANSGTVGFKAATATFADVYAGSRVGLGVQVASINQRFTIGTISGTGNQFDMAIDGAKGMFRVEDQSGNVLYTRNGQFFANKDNYIVNAQGQRLTGLVGTATTPTPIMVPVGNIAPKATEGITTKANFDSNAPVVPAIAVAAVAGKPAVPEIPAVAEVLGEVQLRSSTTGLADGGPRFYTENAGVITWYTDAAKTLDTSPPDGPYLIGGDLTTGTLVTFTDTAGEIKADVPFPVGGIDPNIAYVAPTPAIPAVPAVPAVPEVVGEVQLRSSTTGLADGGPRFYTENAGVITWYTDADKTPDTSPPDGPYLIGGDLTTGTLVTFTDTAGEIKADVPFPVGGIDPNIAYVAPAPAIPAIPSLPAVPAIPAVIPIPFDPAVAASFTHSLNMDVYDSLGNAHQFTQYFAKREAVTGPPDESVWEAYYLLDGNPVTAPASQKLRFSEGGRMEFPAGPIAITVTNVGGAASPAADLALSVDYTNSTQYGGPFSPNFTQTGFATGEYTSMSIAADGSIVASYTNGEVKSVGTLVLANFNNLQGLQPTGGNAWRETSTSGQPILGTPGTNSLATIKGQAVEESNVDMSQELVNMIIAQRTYQANAQTIKTQDQVLQTLINLR